MPLNDLIAHEEVEQANWAAGKGAVIGALKWGAATAVLGAAMYAKWPVYRTTTIQFKV